MNEEKNEESIWNINIKLSDTFDFTKFKMPDEYYNDAKSVSQSLLSSTLYNLAFISYKLGVIKEYQVIAEFPFKVKDGETLVKVYFSNKQAEKFVNEINKNNHWEKLRMSERLQDRVSNADKVEAIPVVKDGYYFFAD